MSLSRRAFVGTLLILPLLGAAAPLPGLRPRADWGALPARPGGRAHILRGLALHHTAGNLVGADRAPAELRSVQRFHQRSRGWIDIAYHCFVDADGTAWEGRDPALVGDTATHYDPAGYLLICALGNFERDQPPPAQVDGLKRLIAALSASTGLPRAGLVAHRDLAQTLCPGRHLYALLDALRAPAP